MLLKNIFRKISHISSLLWYIQEINLLLDLSDITLHWWKIYPKDCFFKKSPKGWILRKNLEFFSCDVFPDLVFLILYKIKFIFKSFLTICFTEMLSHLQRKMFFEFKNIGFVQILAVENIWRLTFSVKWNEILLT